MPERPSERAMRVTDRKHAEEPTHLKPAQVRGLLLKNGWKEQASESEMRPLTRLDLGRVTWWNRGLEVLMLVELNLEEGDWQSAWVCTPARTPSKAQRWITRKDGK